MSPLEGSKCVVTTHDGGLRIEWSRKVASPFRLLIIGFMALWLCGWCFGLVSVTTQIALGSKERAFLIVWLAGWTVGGVFACRMMYQLIRSQAAESVTVSGRKLIYDTGTPDILEVWSLLAAGRRRLSPWAMLSKKRKEYVLDRQNLTTLKLDGDAQSQRLRFDIGADRIEIGSM